MKKYAFLAGFAFAVLAFAAVWLGGLNQDEGWYLYAANMVRDGRMPYRDFFFTQGPLMPIVYSAFAGVWDRWGLLGARVLTCVIGLAATVFAASLARMLAPEGRKGCAFALVSLLLGSNLYHVYYTSTPKTYALASLFVSAGYFLLAAAFTDRGARLRRTLLFGAGASMAFACGSRISLGMLLAACGFGLLFSFRRLGWSFLWFGLGGALALALVYGPFLLDAGAFKGLVAAQRYHAARGGFDVVFTVGSVSRLVRWYLPVFVLLGLGVAARARGRGGIAAERPSNPALPLLFWGFGAVFALQILAPLPYEDYQVPIMCLLAAGASVLACSGEGGSPFSVPQKLLPVLVLGLAWACSFGSPQLEDWMTNGQDRFWTLKKDKCELAQLRDVARIIEAVDPGGKELLTQDVYLAVETGRRVPKGLEMGPFSMLSDAEWTNLLENVECNVAALSGYTFAVEPPECRERPLEKQFEYYSIVKKRYDLVMKEDAFGQNATTLLILKRKSGTK